MTTSEESAVGRTGLKQNTAGFLHVVAQGLLSNGPLASSLLIIPTVAGFALGATPLAYLIGIFVVWFWVNTPYQFGRRYAAASGVSHYVSRGIGTTMGYIAGLSYILYYTFFLAAIAAFIGGPLLQVTLSIVGIAVPGWTWIPFSLLALVPISGLVIYGLKPSLAYGIVTVFAELIVLTVASVIIIVKAGGNNSFAVYSHVPSMKGIAIGMLVAAFGMSGSTATVYLGEEAHLPFRTIRRALVWSTGLVVFVFLLVSYASTVGWGAGRMLSFSTASVPGLVLVGRYIGKWPEFVVALLTINSAIGEGVASTIIVSRLLHSFGDAGLMPSWLSGLVGRRRTPLLAVIMTIVGGLVLALAFGSWQGVIAGISLLLVVTTMAEFIGHFVGNVGLVGEAVRCRLRGVLAFYVLPIVSCISILAGIWATFYPIVTPVIYAPVIVLVLLLVGAAECLLLRSLAPERARRVTERLLAQGEEAVGKEVLIGETREVAW
jgi:amino acid transporter